MFAVRAPGGEWYPQIAARMQSWLASLAPDRDVLVFSHGVALRVLRGLLTGGEVFEGVRIGDNPSQGTVLSIEKGVEAVIHLGTGRGGVRSS